MKNIEEGQLEEGQFEQSPKQQDEVSSEFIKPSRAGRKNLCDVCVKSLAKYTCPGCETKSCTLTCINKHKKDRDCNGKADHTSYIQKGQIDENVVRKDFQFVKEMLKQTDKVKKTLTGVTTQTQEPKRFYFLRKHARSEYNIKIHQAPPIIERHRENISFFYMKTKTIYWVVEVLYYKAHNRYSKTLLEPQADSKTISQILPTDFLCQQLLLKQINTQKPEQFDVFIQNREVSHEQDDKKCNKEGDRRNESEQTSKEREKQLIEVQKDKKLYQVLKNLNIYEFPTLIMVHKSLRKQFLRKKKIT